MATLKLSPKGHRFGYHKNPPDPRDLGVGRLPLKAADAPAMNNGMFMGPTLNQGQQGSCSAHASAGDREFLHWKQVSALGKTVAPGTDGIYSPSFIYFLERQLDAGWVPGQPFISGLGDVGSTGRTSCQVLNKFGCALRSEMPYNDADFSTPPTPAQLTDGLQWPTGGYHFAANVDDMKSIIATGYNFRIGFTVYDSFENIGADGIWTPDTSTEQVLGGHEVLCYGFDDTVNGGSFLVRNSWGADWGKSGDFFMRYIDAANSDILMDAACQHLGIWKS